LKFAHGPGGLHTLFPQHEQQFPETQSLLLPQCPLVPQGGHDVPPQSVSDSFPSWMPFSQEQTN
jgi:hypothetical protein